MEISALTLKLIILLIPGALGTIVYRRLIIQHKPQSDFMFVIISIMFGMFSYLILQILNYFFVLLINICKDPNIDYYAIDTFANLSNGNAIPYLEVFWASLFCIFLGFVISKIDHKKTINNIARKWNVSNKYGDENLYSYFLNSPDTTWVYIRDIENSLTYFGNVEMFSETTEYKEIVLRDVTVFNYPDSEELYDIDRIYLSLPKDKLIIEQAKKVNENG